MSEPTISEVVAELLATAMGHPKDETRAVVTSAYDGNANDWEALRNRYGITTRELIRFGAVPHPSRAVLLHDEESRELNWMTLCWLVVTKYGKRTKEVLA